MEKSQMKTEALSRMRTLQEKFNLNPKLLRYLEDEKLYYSYRVSGWSFGCIDTINYDERYLTAVEEFEEITGNYVYHVIETKLLGHVRTVDTGNTEISYLEKVNEEPVTLLTFLFVSPDEENWMAERLEYDYLFAYVLNIDEQESSCCCGGYYGEYGDVFLTSDNGALLRRA